MGGMDSFVESVGTDAQYMMGISPWDPSLVSKDAVVSWSASKFAELFLATTWRTSTYHSASAAASVSVIVQAIERADSFDSDAVASVLATKEFVTLYGTLSFDDNGQSMAPSLFLQYDQNTTVQTVYPPDAKSGDLRYPMPTWDHRDCILVATCESGSASTVRGKCQEDGTCFCDQEGAVSSGIGVDAACLFIPVEDMTKISSTLKILGIILFAVQVTLSLACAAWTVYYRNEALVNASQPLFLSLVCFGTLVMSLSIIPLGVQGEYRHEQDQQGQLTSAPNPDIALIDAGCMAVPWLLSLGFSIVFSALFAKIVRIMLVLKAAENFVRKTVGAKDVAYIMVGVIAVQVVVLTCWQIIDPLLWQREVLSWDNNDYPTKSIGVCESEHALRYIIPLVVADAIMLLFALYLGFRTRNISTKYQEGTWITASVLSSLQILMLAAPILLIVENDTTASYFIKVVVVFLFCSTVTMLIFFPKMYQLHFAPEVEPEVVDDVASLTSKRHISPAGGSRTNDRSSNAAMNRSSALASGTVSNLAMGDCSPSGNGGLSNISNAGEQLTSGGPSTVEAVETENPDGDGKVSSQSNSSCIGTAALSGSTMIASGRAEDMATA